MQQHCGHQAHTTTELHGGIFECTGGLRLGGITVCPQDSIAASNEAEADITSWIASLRRGETTFSAFTYFHVSTAICYQGELGPANRPTYAVGAMAGQAEGQVQLVCNYRTLSTSGSTGLVAKLGTANIIYPTIVRHCSPWTGGQRYPAVLGVAA